MISLKKVIINPNSPDRALEQASIKESAHARLAHVNRLAKEVYDIKFYELDVDTTTTLNITSRKGIVEILNADSGSTSITLWLRNPEITADHDKFYTQLSVYSNSSAITPIVIGRGYSGDMFEIELKNLDVADDWGLLYFYYEIVKID